MKRSPIQLNPTPDQLRTGSTLTRKPIAREAVVHLAPRKPLAKVSAKQAAENRERTKVLAVLRARYPVCQRCGVRPSQDGHELKRRSGGGSITDMANIRMVCRPCHDWIGANPAQAIRDGWAKSRFANA